MIEWVRVYGYWRKPRWGFKVPAGQMKKRDLPTDFQCCVEPVEGALPDFRLHAGRLWLAEWRQARPIHWPEATWREILPGAYVLEAENYAYSVAGSLDCPAPLADVV